MHHDRGVIAYCSMIKEAAKLNAQAHALATSNAIANTLLAEAHDDHLVTSFFEGEEKLLAKGCRAPRGGVWQKAFWSLIDQGLIHECDRRGLDAVGQAQAIFAPTCDGLEVLREQALDKDMNVALSLARWNEEPVFLDWQDPLMCWEVYQGQILGDVVDDNGSIIVGSAVVAEVGLYRLSVTLCDALGVGLAQALESHPDLQSYQSLGRDSDGAPILFDDLMSSVGLAGGRPANLVILDRLKVRADFIGLGLGSQIISRLFLRYGQAGGVAVLTPFPLQFGGCLKTDNESYINAEDSLRRYYRRLGFTRHPTEPELMVCNLASNRLTRRPKVSGT